MAFDESRLRELQTALRAKTAANKELADSFEIVDGTVVVPTEKKDFFQSNMKDIREIKGLIDDLNVLKDVENWGAHPEVDSIAAAIAAGKSVAGVSAKTLGELFLDSPEFKALQNGKAGANMPSPFLLQKGNIGAMWGMEQKDVYSSMPGGTITAFGSVTRDPMVFQPKRTRRVRDLFPQRTTTSAVIEYFRMTGFTNAASTVAERDGSAFQLKPQSAMTFVGEQAPVRTIAHWEAAHRNALADEPQLRGIIDNELLYGLRLEEDNQILNGSGTGEDLMGLLTVTGTQSYAWSSGATAPVSDNMADAIRRAATLSFLAFYEPTGVVLHPSDWEKIELAKDANGQYLVAVSVALGGEPRVWRMPVIDSPAIAEGTAVVGAFGTGAQLYDREEANIRISEHHSDFFIRNAIVILAEERLALAIKRPESFVIVDFDMAP